MILLLILLSLLCLLAVMHQTSTVKANPETKPALTGAQLFTRDCARCHGRDGRARGKPRGTRNLTDAQWHDRVSDERIFNSINLGKGKMPGFSKKLSEAEIDELVKYVRTLRK